MPRLMPFVNHCENLRISQIFLLLTNSILKMHTEIAHAVDFIAFFLESAASHTPSEIDEFKSSLRSILAKKCKLPPPSNEF